MRVFEFIHSRFTRKGLAILAVMIAVFLSCFVLFLKSPTSFRLFIFESLDHSGLFAEKRFLSKEPEQEQVLLFAEDLLLGSLTPRLKSMFPAGTSILSCFVRKGTLYIDLSEHALVYSDGSAVTPDSVEIFKKNFFENFNFIKKIHVYVMGREV